MAEQVERAEQRHSEQVNLAERRNEHVQGEHETDIYEAKFEAHRRQQRREREDAVRSPSRELRQARAAAAKTTAPAPASDAREITRELRAAQTEAREAPE